MGWRTSIRGLGALPLARLEPLPAESPLGGALWSVVVPALLFALSLGATWLLYRHFSRR